MHMQDFEKLGLFYLGKRYDPASGTVLDEPVLYDSRDLVTHAVCVGMTGSGKTGLCLGVIEEAAIDGIPVIAIDPKGDLGNVLLTFPLLMAEDFLPWVDPDEARRSGRSLEAHAAEEARRWKEGLAAWGEDGARIERLRKSADFTIYTPGSSAGQRVSILSSFAAPVMPRGSHEPERMFEETVDRAANTATSVLALAGVDAPPRSREHTIVATLFTNAWSRGRDLDLATLIQQLQTPPVQKIGVVDLESFYPAKDRFDLAMRLNGLLGAPGFDQWLEGESLDPASLLYTAEGRPRVAIFSIAHLGDAERMFFVSLLLNQIVGWMRRQTGTSSLRAIVYMDEIMGYFPPVANPPSKGPLLTILKQGRAFGVGALLATQNPVDLDYKGLGNAGTWFLGRLQTERDKLRVLDGLESAVAGGIDRAEADRLLSGLGKRVFLLHNVHEERPLLFQTRWTMSYLRGPLSNEEIRQLKVQGSRVHGFTGSGFPVQGSGLGAEPSAPLQPSAFGVQSSPTRPVVPPGIEEFFVPAAARGPVRYTPVVLGAAQVAFTDPKLNVAEQREVLYAASIREGAVPVDWSEAKALDVEASALVREPEPGSSFDEVPAPALMPKNYAAWEKAFSRFLGEAVQIELLFDRELKLTSHVGESERDFRIRAQEALREARDKAVDDLRKKYAPKRSQLADQLRRAEAAVERETQQASHAKLQTAVSMGATLLGAILGRKAVSSGSVGRATTAARGVGRSMKETEDIKRATENVQAIREREQALEAEAQREIQGITDRFTGERQFDRVTLAPKRGQVSVHVVALGWLPSDLRV
jgi:hypothetical protein